MVTFGFPGGALSVSFQCPGCENFMNLDDLVIVPSFRSLVSIVLRCPVLIRISE